MNARDIIQREIHTERNCASHIPTRILCRVEDGISRGPEEWVVCCGELFRPDGCPSKGLRSESDWINLIFPCWLRGMRDFRQVNDQGTTRQPAIYTKYMDQARQARADMIDAVTRAGACKMAIPSKKYVRYRHRKSQALQE